MATYTFLTPAQADGQGTELSDKGIEQAVNMGASLADREFSAILIEPTSAARITASFAAGLDPEIEIRELPELNAASTPVRGQGQALIALRTRLGEVPLRKFRDENPILMRDFALEAALAIQAAANETNAAEVLIVAGNIIVQAIGLMLAPDQEKAEDVLLELMLGEAEGFTIKEDGEIALLKQEGM